VGQTLTSAPYAGGAALARQRASSSPRSPPRTAEARSRGAVLDRTRRGHSTSACEAGRPMWKQAAHRQNPDSHVRVLFMWACST
jgi:hypothetical protein